jgi:hypothetical protein
MRGGKRKGAGRKKDPIEKGKLTVQVPIEYKEAIREKVKKISKAYEDKCKREK